MAQDQNSHLRCRSTVFVGVMLIRSLLVTNHIQNSGEAASSSRAFSVESWVNVSHSTFENFLLSGVVWITEGYDSSSENFSAEVLVKPDVKN